MTPLTRLLLLGCVFASSAAGTPIEGRAKATASWIDNLSRTSDPVAQRDAATYEAAVSAAVQHPLPAGLLSSVSIEASALACPEYERIGEHTIGLHASLRWKAGLGAFAPVLRAEASFASRDARFSSADGWTADASLRLSKRFTESWRATLGVDWQEDGARTKTFDARQQRLFTEISWDLSPRWQLSAGGALLHGDFTANAASATWAGALAGAAGPVIQQYYNTVPAETTGIYGPAWVSYRIRAQAREGWLELAPALSDRTSLALRYTQVVTVNRADVTYRQELLSLSLLHVF